MFHLRSGTPEIFILFFNLTTFIKTPTTKKKIELPRNQSGSQFRLLNFIFKKNYKFTISANNYIKNYAYF